MGMFDYVTCEYQLPIDGNFNDRLFQSKDTPCQFCENFVIDKDGQLFYIENDENGNKAGGPIKDDFTGIIRFYDFYYQDRDVNTDECGWIEFEADFLDGICKSIKLIRLENDDNLDA